MKICILTQPLARNYGGILQAYALQRVLRDMGHDVTTLRFPPLIYTAPSKCNLYWQTFRRFLSKLRGNKSILFANPTRQSLYSFQINTEIDRFISQNIKYLCVNAPLKSTDVPAFDAYIVGSDQVWRPAYSPCLTNFYLDFLSETCVKRFAYAASFGVDTWETDSDTTKIIRPLARQFNRISVREETAINLCKQYLDVEADLMPDPTLLLSGKDYLSLAFRDHSSIEKQKYIAAYILDKNAAKWSLLDKISAKKGLPIKTIGNFNWTNGQDSIEDWLLGIANAEYVVTDSFHGTVFSLLFHKDFLTINNVGRGSSRFNSLLGELGLMNHIVQMDSNLSWEEKPIDYDRVQAILEIKRQQGLSFLKGIS